MKIKNMTRLSVVLLAALSIQGCAMWNRMWGNDMPAHTETSKPVQDAAITNDAREPAAAAATPQEPVATAPYTPPSAEQAPVSAADTVPLADSVIAEVPATAATEPSTTVEMSLSGDALFAFGKSDEASITPEGRDQLDQLVSKLMGMKDAIDSVQVIGHADRLGLAQRNLRLSERRAEAVKSYLSAQGIDELLIQTEGRGSDEAVVDCPGNKATKALIQCLAPNRRVEVIAQVRK